ncbi:MAG TPA: hypothetical protein VEJ23_03015 [Solirubrobacteraceae bacterium]|nr:hypothetical protein [Solirubrobacteraceae bacterium]
MRGDVVEMRSHSDHTITAASPRQGGRALGACALALVAVGLLTCTHASASGVGARAARNRFACVGENSTRVPCHFSTPSGNVRCLWTPKPNSVACVVVASGRAYRLRPTGRARLIHLTLRRRGETLPTDQQILFPDSLSCQDTARSMTCNQDFGLGAFTLPLRAQAAR